MVLAVAGLSASSTMTSIHHPGRRGVWTLPVETPLGEFTAQFTDRGLARLRFPTGRPCQCALSAADLPAPVRQWASLTERALALALRGSAPGQLPPLDWSGASLFRRKVWRALLKVRPGHTASYGQVARLIQQPNAARAVGAACGANPVPVLVPCHRVVAADGGLGGFSGGLRWKRTLLAAEGVLVAA